MRNAVAAMMFGVLTMAGGCGDDDDSCTVGALRCASSVAVERCNADGDGWEADHACGGGETCVQGVCGTVGVCGDGTCNLGEDCASCNGDCGCTSPAECLAGVCQVPTCGDGTCSASETCGGCPGDCGACPAPTFDCVGDVCSYTGCDGYTYSDIVLADEIATDPNCAGQVPQWFLDASCFTDRESFDRLAEITTCELWYVYCPCVDSPYEWTRMWMGTLTPETPAIEACGQAPGSCTGCECGAAVCGVDPCGNSCGTCDFGSCLNGACCGDGCITGNLCCGPPLCAGDCAWSPCCT